MIGKQIAHYRVRIDPEKSDKTTSFVRFHFADGTSAGSTFVAR